jgi:hypothetical protein
MTKNGVPRTPSSRAISTFLSNASRMSWLSASPGASVRHSGTLVKIGLDLSTILLEEVVAWSGLGTDVVRRSIRLGPGTSIELIERPDGRSVHRAGRSGWHATTIPAAALREGDFVTVITDRRGIADELQVVRPMTD